MTLPQEEYANKGDNLLFQKIKAKKWDDVRSLLCDTDGQVMAKEQDEFDNLPLHSAIGYRAPEDVVLSLLSLYPEACEVHGTDYWLPLHVAAMWGASSDVVEALIRRYPQALDDRGEPGIKGRSPRHFSDRFPHNKVALERSTEEWVKIIADDEGRRG